MQEKTQFFCVLARVWGNFSKIKTDHSSLELEALCPLAYRRLLSQIRWAVREAELPKNLAWVLPLRPQFSSFSRGSLSSHGPETHISNFSFLDPISPPKHPGASFLQVENLGWLSTSWKLNSFSVQFSLRKRSEDVWLPWGWEAISLGFSPPLLS